MGLLYVLFFLAVPFPIRTLTVCALIGPLARPWNGPMQKRRQTLSANGELR